MANSVQLKNFSYTFQIIVIEFCVLYGCCCCYCAAFSSIEDSDCETLETETGHNTNNNISDGLHAARAYDCMQQLHLNKKHNKKKTQNFLNYQMSTSIICAYL